jgi:hypothetical protein
MTGSPLVAANALTRLAYGVAALVAPSKPLLGKVPLAPDTERFPEARLFIRGFAAHQVAVSTVGIASLARRNLQRSGMTLAAATDLADIVSALVEARARGRLDPDLRDGLVFSAAGLVTALAALRGAQTPPRSATDTPRSAPAR